MPSYRVPMGEADLSPLAPYLKRVDELAELVKDCRDIRPNATNNLTARFIDENQAAGPRTYMHAYDAISSAHEHSEALWALINSDYGLTPRTPWTLVRSVFEAGFWATWILDSEHSFIRRQRGLKVEMVDRSEHRKWVNSLPVDQETKNLLYRGEKAENTYKSECQSLALPWKTAGVKPAVASEIHRLGLCVRSGPDLGPYVESIWRSLSGLEHGHPYATQIHTDRDQEVKIVGGSTFRVSVNDDSFIAACKCAYALFIEGAELYISRSTEPRRAMPQSRG